MISVIIPTYNRATVLIECVESVLRSDYQEIEIIVVDNASTDNTCALIDNLIRTDNRVRLIRLPENLMAAGGRNAGIKEAKGDYLCFLDNDNEVEPNMLSEMLKVFERDPEVGFVGALSINPGNRIWTVSGDYNFWTSRPVNKYADMSMDQIKQLDDLYTTYYSQNCSMVSRNVVERVKGFDRLLYAMYEEADFGYRVSRTGCKMYICTKAVTHHKRYCEDRRSEQLREYMIESLERAFHFAKNRSIFMSRYAPGYCKPVFFGIFLHLMTAFYVALALKNKRADIAKAIVEGTIYGFRIRHKEAIY